MSLIKEQLIVHGKIKCSQPETVQSSTPRLRYMLAFFSLYDCSFIVYIF